MKILLMSVKAGFGHHSAAQALIECFEGHGMECRMLDTLEYVNKLLGDGVQEGYLLSTKYLKKPYGKIYSHLDKKTDPYFKYSPLSLLSNQISKSLIDYIEDYNPDIIIGTHSYAAVLMTILKNKKIINCPTFGIITDFTIHPFWESTELDYYITPDELLNHVAMQKGIPKEKILPIGIPVKKQFATRVDKQVSRNRLKLPDKTTVMVMMGSMGFGDVKDVISEIDAYPKDFQIVCICGNNKKAKQQIDEVKWNKDIYCFGFITNVHEYMDAADILITKPGGLTTSEALAKQLPLILSNPIPGQEDRNIEFLVNAGAALCITKTFSLSSALYQFLDCSWRKHNMIDAITHLGKPNSAENLYNFIENLDKKD